MYPVPHYFISHANDPNGLFLPSPTPQFETFQVFLIYFRSDQVTAQRNTVPTVALDQFILKNNFSLVVEGASVFLNATYVVAVLE